MLPSSLNDLVVPTLSVHLGEESGSTDSYETLEKEQLQVSVQIRSTSANLEILNVNRRRVEANKKAETILPLQEWFRRYCGSKQILLQFVQSDRNIISLFDKQSQF